MWNRLVVIAVSCSVRCSAYECAEEDHQDRYRHDLTVRQHHDGSMSATQSGHFTLSARFVTSVVESSRPQAVVA